MGLYTNVGERHFSSGYRDRIRPFLQHWHAQTVSARVNCVCSGWFGVPCCCFWWSHVLSDTNSDYLGSGYDRKLFEYPIFDLRLLKRCLQKVSSAFFGYLDQFSMTDFIVKRLKWAEHRDWMMSHSRLRRAIITGGLSMLSLFEVANNIVGVWPLIPVYLKEIGRKTDVDSLVV